MTTIEIPVQLRWSDMDAYGHVNNVEMLRLLEEARIEAFWRHPEADGVASRPTAILDASPGARTATLVAHQEIEYLAPITTMVLVDSASGKPRRIDADERAAWEPFLDAPVAMRRRAR